MGKKYIIELPENTHWIQWIMEGTKDHHPYMDWKLVEDLTPYTEPDLEQVRKEAYEEGYYIGYSRYINKSFEDGLKGSWEAARKIICEMDYEDHIKIFGGDNLDYIFALSPTTVIEKLKAYEQEQKEIKVGDEVGYYGVADEDGNINYSGVVLEIRTDDTALQNWVRDIVVDAVLEHKDEIVTAAASMLCEYMKRTKAVKEAVAGAVEGRNE